MVIMMISMMMMMVLEFDLTCVKSEENIFRLILQLLALSGKVLLLANQHYTYQYCMDGLVGCVAEKLEFLGQKCERNHKISIDPMYI